MNNAPLVSVVIPAYNMARFLPQAVQSVLDQTYRNFEIHVIDDGSTDDTAKVMEAFANNPQVHYHYQTNRGESGARNTGLRVSKGEFVAFCDADDLWEPNKLEVQVPCFQGKPELGVVYTNTQHVDINNNPVETYRTTRHNGKITAKLLLQNFVTGATSMIRKKCFDAVGFYDESLKVSQDYDMWLRLSTVCEFFYLDEITYRYRQWPGQVSNAKNELRFFSDSIRVRERFIKDHPGVVDASVVDELWARVYADRALAIMRADKNRMAAFSDILRSLRYRFGRLNTWKAAIKVLINRVE